MSPTALGCGSVPERPLRQGAAALADLLGQSDEKSFGSPDVAEPIHVFVLNHFAYELRAFAGELGYQFINIFNSEHDPKVPKSVHRSSSVV